LHNITSADQVKKIIKNVQKVVSNIDVHNIQENDVHKTSEAEKELNATVEVLETEPGILKELKSDSGRIKCSIII
jgi:hypothetical protein